MLDGLHPPIVADLIDTLWNVKKMNDFKKGELLGDLIDTLWNVKSSALSILL